MNKSTIQYKCVYKRSESNLLPPTVSFDQIDGSYNDSNKLNRKIHKIIYTLTDFVKKHVISVKAQTNQLKQPIQIENKSQHIINRLFDTSRPQIDTKITHDTTSRATRQVAAVPRRLGQQKRNQRELLLQAWLGQAGEPNNSTGTASGTTATATG